MSATVAFILAGLVIALGAWWAMLPVWRTRRRDRGGARPGENGD